MCDPVLVRRADVVAESRWKIACINWSQPPEVPRALAYLYHPKLGMLAEAYRPTYEAAVAYVNDQIAKFTARQKGTP